jgi:Cu-Zn family superoxide dismutase
MDIFEIIVEKKKKYVSLKNIEKEDIKQFILDLVNHSTNKNVFSNDQVEKTWNEVFGGNVKFSFVDGSLFESECKHRIDIELKGQIYRILLLSCDGSTKIQDIIRINKDIDLLQKRNVSNLFCSMYDIQNKYIGNLMISSPKKNQIKLIGILNHLESYANKKLGIHVHTKGDLTDQCKNCGMHYNPLTQFHGGRSGERHLGDLGNINVDEKGVANINVDIDLMNLDPFVVMGSFAGRSIVLHDKEDDLGKGDNNESAINGNSGGRIACGVIGGEFIF